MIHVSIIRKKQDKKIMNMMEKNERDWGNNTGKKYENTLVNDMRQEQNN